MGPATHYEHSGKAPLGGILLTLIVGTVAGVVLGAINLIGPWSIFGWTPTGFSLWAIWGIEAAAILGISAISARGINDVPFCEATGRWATEVTLPLHFAPLSDTAEFNSPGSLLGALRPAEDDSAAYTTVSVSTVEESDLRCVSIESVTVETNKKGEEQTNKTNVVKNLLFDRDSFEKLLRIAQPAANQEL